MKLLQNTVETRDDEGRIRSSPFMEDTVETAEDEPDEVKEEDDS